MQSVLVFLCGKPDIASHHSSEVDSLFHPTTQGEFKQCSVTSDWVITILKPEIMIFIGVFLGLNWKVLCFVYYHIARKFRGVKFLRKLIRLSFHDFIFTDSDPIAIINDVNIVLWIKIFTGGDKSMKTVKILPRETF